MAVLTACHSLGFTLNGYLDPSDLGLFYVSGSCWEDMADVLRQEVILGVGITGKESDTQKGQPGSQLSS